MRKKYTSFIDNVEERIPEQGERPRPGMTRELINEYENIKNEGYRLLEMGDARLNAFNWD
ncbi:hypothetical protein [Spirosoma jeollabukense]